MGNKFKIFIVLMTISISGLAQNSSIIGRVNLMDVESKDFVIKNNLVILTSKNLTDATKLDKNLTFKFENLSADSFLISFSLRSYPYSTSYLINLEGSETKNLSIPFWSSCPYKKTKNGI